MIILPPGPRRKWLMSFWLAISLVAGVLGGALLAVLIAPRWLGAGGIIAAVVAVPGLLRPQVAARPYQWWRRAARSYCRGVCLLLTGICFYTVLVIAGRAGSALKLTRPRAGRTLWVPRTTLASTAYAHPYNRADPAAPPEGWLGTYLSWAARSGHVWAAALVPFLIMLEIFEPDLEKGRPANVYTLF